MSYRKQEILSGVHTTAHSQERRTTDLSQLDDQTGLGQDAPRSIEIRGGAPAEGGSVHAAQPAHPAASQTAVLMKSLYGQPKSSRDVDARPAAVGRCTRWGGVSQTKLPGAPADEE